MAYRSDEFESQLSVQIIVQNFFFFIISHFNSER